MKPTFFVVCCALMLYGLFRPQSPPDLFEQSDKALHLLAFGALALSSRLAFERVPGWGLWGVLFAMAPLLEWLQHAVQPVRQFSQDDILANALGVLLALLAWLTWQALRSRLRLLR